MMSKSGLFAGLVAVSAFASQSASAGCGPTYCEDVPIKTMWVRSENILIKVNADASALNCSLVGGTSGYVVLPYTAHYKDFYASLLAHQLADRPISFNIESGVSSCTIKDVYTNSP